MKFVIFNKGGKIRMGMGDPAVSKGREFRLISDTGRNEKVSRREVLFYEDTAVNGEIARFLARLKGEAMEIAATIDTEVIRELFSCQEKGLEDIALEWFGGDSPSLTEVAGMAMALAGDPVRFRVHGGKVIALDRETVEKRVQRKEREEEFRERVKADLGFLLALKEGEMTVHPDPERLFRWVRGWLEGEPPEDDVAEKVLQGMEKRTKSIEQALLKVLKYGGREIDIPSILQCRYRIPGKFSEEAEGTARNLFWHGGEISVTDLTHLFTFTIDGDETTDFDDALSVEVEEGYIDCWIHIADCSLIEEGSPLDREANKRVSSLYLPDRKIPMLPPSLSDDLLSLREGPLRYALTHYLRIERDSGEVIRFDLFPSLITVDRNLTFEETGEGVEWLEARIGDRLLALDSLRQVLLNRRVQKGAVIPSPREVKIKVERDGKVSIKEVDRNNRGMQIIEELSILTNFTAARFSREKGLPALYRYVERRGIILSFEPLPHSGIGLEAYTQVTSPIRRYPDMLMQRQILHWLRGGGFLYMEDTDFLARAKDVEDRFLQLREFQRSIERYWKLVYLSQNPGSPYRVVTSTEGKPFLHELLLPLTQPLPDWLHPSMPARARVKRVDPETLDLEIEFLKP